MTIQNIPKRILCCITWRINIKANGTIGQLWLLADTALSTAQNLIAGTTIIHFCDGRVLSALLALKRNSWFHRSLKVGFWRDKRKRSMNILSIMGFDKRQKQQLIITILFQIDGQNWYIFIILFVFHWILNFFRSLCIHSRSYLRMPEKPSIVKESKRIGFFENPRTYRFIKFGAIGLSVGIWSFLRKNWFLFDFFCLLSDLILFNSLFF